MTTQKSPAGDATASSKVRLAVVHAEADDGILKSYPIGTVSKLSGIPVETLRIWERRYQLLVPSRTEGKHRLYSEMDITTLRAVRMLLDSGWRIGAVAKLPRAEIRAAADRIGDDARQKTETAQTLASLIDDVIDAGRALDAERAATLLDRPLLMHDSHVVVDTLYMPLLQKVGAMWHAGELSIAVEHLLEKLVTARLYALLQQAPRGTGPLVVCACLPDDRHEVGLLASAIALKKAGFGVAFLGADLPASELVSAAQKLAPKLIVLGATNAISPATKRDIPPALSTTLRHIPLILGGPTAVQLAALLDRPATVLTQVRDLPDTARALLAAFDAKR